MIHNLLLVTKFSFVYIYNSTKNNKLVKTNIFNIFLFLPTKSIFIYGGTVATVVGIILVLSNQDENSFGFNAGIVTTSIGVGFVSGGIGMNFINRYPSNIADMAIQEYNKQLQENILNNSK